MKTFSNTDSEVPRFKWLHVATEGDFEGHADGKFSLNRDVFEAFVANLRADPRYRGGTSPVIPFDFEHASELAATNGSIPAAGAPAPAWVCDLDVREGPSGEAQLWAYAKLGNLIRGYIENNEYRHVSIAFTLNGTDPQSGDSIGPMVTSIAFTNHPFLRGITPIAASSKGATDMPRALFGRSVSLADEREERQPVDLSELPIDLDAPDAVDRAIEILVESDASLEELDDEALRQYVEACIAHTKELQTQRTGLAERSNPLRLTEAELDAVDDAPNATAAAVAVLSLRDPNGYAKNERRHFLTETRELARRLRAWAADCAEPEDAPEERRLAARESVPSSVSSKVLTLYRNSTGRNALDRMVLALRNSGDYLGFENRPYNEQLRFASRLVQAVDPGALRPLKQPSRPSRSSR
jgi:hypothetical protein